MEKQLTTKQALREILKTDKVNEKFLNECKKFLSYNDGSNSAKFKRICEAITPLFSEGYF